MISRKLTFILTFIVSLISTIELYSQHQNMTSNSGFEIGSYQGCNNGDWVLQNWEIVGPGCGHFANPAPKWIDKNYTACFNDVWNEYSGGFIPTTLPSNRFIWMKTQDDEDRCSRDRVAVIFCGLTENLSNNTRYRLQFKYLPLRFDNVYGYNDAHLRIFFSEWGEHWNSGATYENYNLGLIETPHTTGTGVWKVYDKTFNFSSTGSSPYRNIVLFVEEGGFAIDDVELSVLCRDDKLIQNKIYDGYFYGSNQGTYVEKSSNYILAGYDVGCDSYVPGNVVVNQYANVAYKAENYIELFNGFEAIGDFETHIISNCFIERISKDSVNILDPQTELTDESKSLKLTIFPNPSSGKITLSKSDEERCTVRIISVQGKLLSEVEMNQSIIELDLQGYKNGLYFIVLINNQSLDYKKVSLVKN